MKEALPRLDPECIEYLLRLWPLFARSQQLPKPGDWTTWLIMGGRGSGKTRAGAEWIRGMACGNPLFTAKPVGRIALVGETYSDVRDVMIEGESGLLNLHTSRERPTWISSRRRLEWPNGAVAQTYSSEDPEALRGPQFEISWCDEIGKWNYAEETWNMLQFGLRLGDFPRQVVTTTPRPIKLLKDMIADDRSHVSRMTTDQNRENLAGGFFDRVVKVYRGTRLGRQELDGELIADRPGALWQRELIERDRTKVLPQMKRTVVAVDPPVTGKSNSDACGIIVAGIGQDGRAYVIKDRSLKAVSPSRWSKMVINLAHTHQVDRVVIETNQGGDMAEDILRAAEPNLSIRQVKATRGKWMRAEPVAHLYERGLVSHFNSHPELEDEMCSFGLDGLPGNRSPDRMDALVWALTDLLLRPAQQPRTRSL